jgi:hypothetical protein
MWFFFKFRIWDKIYSTCLCEFSSFYLTNVLQLYPFFHKGHVLFFRCNKTPFSTYIQYCLYTFIDGHLPWLHNLTTVNSGTKNMGMQVSPLQTDFNSLGYTQKRTSWIICFF